MNNKIILAISSHIDDIELSCGATIYKMRQNKNKVYAVILSDCRSTLIGTKFKKNSNKIQCYQALHSLLINKENIFLHHLQEKFYFKQARKIYDILENLRLKLNPHVVLIPSPSDTHQDHSTVAHEAISVFRRQTTILAYEQPWNNLTFHANYFSAVNEDQVDKKIAAINKYQTQFYFKRDYFDETLIKGWSRTRGSQIKQKYAEAFEVIKFIE